MKSAQTIAMLTAAVMVAITGRASAQSSAVVTVPGNALGSFGSPSSGSVPYVAALTVPGRGEIEITYLSGTVTDGGGVNTGPNGTVWDFETLQTPLQEAVGIAGGTVLDLDALIGVFVPQSRVRAAGFSAVDGTKDLTPVGILPVGLFFIGTHRTIAVKEAGTLFLGINDDHGVDNGGAFTVSSRFIPTT